MVFSQNLQDLNQIPARDITRVFYCSWRSRTQSTHLIFALYILFVFWRTPRAVNSHSVNCSTFTELLFI